MWPFKKESPEQRDARRSSELRIINIVRDLIETTQRMYFASVCCPHCGKRLIEAPTVVLTETEMKELREQAAIGEQT